MSTELTADEKQPAKRPKPVDKAPDKQRPTGPSSSAAQVLNLQRQVGNQAVQRLLAQRSGDGAFELDEATTGRINSARGGGQSLDGTVQEQMSTAMGQDFSGVRVHTSPEADTLNQQLSAKAFTTGQDIFFQQGAYDPGSSSGQELIAHELTHVVQQSSGAVNSPGSGMTVNPPGDVYEQEADTIAKQAVHLESQAGTETAEAGVQRQEVPEEEDIVQGKSIQRQEIPEEEDLVQEKSIQRQEIPEEEDLVQEKSIQRQEVPEEEEEEVPPIQTKAIQRQESPPLEEESPVQTKAIQRQEVGEEELA